MLSSTAVSSYPALDSKCVSSFLADEKKKMKRWYDLSKKTESQVILEPDVNPVSNSKF